jgi:hypothetical protein
MERNDECGEIAHSKLNMKAAQRKWRMKTNGMNASSGSAAMAAYQRNK